ncbi:MAG: hypothetical protein R3321_01440 [Nitrososphaeraceae archaeon]|nr:hypothetical protein [Nitrososphaeraceae archaeon]
MSKTLQELPIEELSQDAILDKAYKHLSSFMECYNNISDDDRKIDLLLHLEKVKGML